MSAREHGIAPATAVLACSAFVLRAWGGQEGVRLSRESGDVAETPMEVVVPASAHRGLVDFAAELQAGMGERPGALPALGTATLTLEGEGEPVELRYVIGEPEDGSGLLGRWEATEVGGAHVADGVAAACRRLLAELAASDATWERADLGYEPHFAHFPLPLGATVANTEGPLGPLGALDEGVRQAMSDRAEETALCGTAGELSYGELARRVGAVAAWLRGQEVAAGSPVAIVMHKCTNQVAAALAVVAAGAAYVPVDAAWPPDRVAQVIKQAGARTTLTSSDVLEAGVLSDGPGVLAVDRCAAVDDLPQAAPVAPEDLAYIIYTSGSTGMPKGVALSHGAARNTNDDINDRFRVGPDDRVLGVSSLSFDLSVYDIFGVLGVGGRLVLPDAASQRDPGHWRELMAEHGVTIWNSAPALLEMLVDYSEADPEQARRDLASLRLVMLSGDWIPVTLPDRLRALAPQAQIVSLGGATEAAIWSVHYPIGEVDPEWQSIPYGVPLSGQWFHILDEEQRPVPVGAAGELHIGGLGLAQEYWADPERTAERFFTHPETGHRLYRTGDLGRWRTDGTIEFLGRNDRQVKVRGHRIELGEIETLLNRHPLVRQSTVSALRDATRGARLVAYVALFKQAPKAAEVLRDHLAAALPSYMVPGAMVLLDALPTTANGKIDYAALPDADALPDAAAPAAADQDVAAEEFREPTTPSELALADIWSEILGIDDIGLDEDFFSLGGDSLLAVRMANTVKAHTGVAIPLTRVFEGDTLEQFARFIDGGGTQAEETAPESLTAEDAAVPFPLTDLQQAYWIGQQHLYDLSHDSAHFYLDFEAEGLDVAALQTAVDRIVRHQPMLRSTVLPDGRQEILDEVPSYPLRSRDLCGRPEDEQREAVERTREEMTHEGPRPESWPLFDLRVDLLDGDRARLYLCCSLLIADGWSFNLFFEELFAAHQDPEAELEPLAISFRDYVLAREEKRDGAEYEQDRAYWHTKLDTLAPAPQLPMVDDPSQARTDHMTRRTGGLDAERWQAFRGRCSERGLTTSTVLAAAYAQVIAEPAASPDFSLTVLYFNRLPLHPDLERMLGPFASTTLLEVNGAGSTSLTTRAQRLSSNLGEAIEHGLFSGVDAVRELARRKGGTTEPLMPVVFTSTIGFSSWYRRPETQQIQVRDVFEQVRTPQVHLDLQVYEQDGGMRYNLDAIEELFVPGTVPAIATAYQELLERLADDDAQWEKVTEQHRQVSGRAVAASPAPLLPTAEYEAPADPVEAGLAEVWQELLDVPRVSATANFFQLGGDSLLAIRMLAKVMQRYGQRVRPAELMARPTVRALAERLRGLDVAGGQPDTTEVLLRDGDAALAPLFLVHPSGGDVMCYAELARLVEDGRPMVALQDRALAGAEGIPGMSGMAEEYHRIIKARQPQGPYFLAGWSLGGDLAHEIACRLQEDGERVALLAMIDSNAPGAITATEWVTADDDVYPMLRFVQSLEAYQARTLLTETPQALAALPPAERARRIARCLSAAGLLPQQDAEAELAARTRMFDRHLRALLGFRPRTFHGDVLLFRATEESPRNSRMGMGVDDAQHAANLGWTEHVDGTIKEFTVPGHHYNVIQAPGVKKIAEVLNEALEKQGAQ